VAVFNPLISVLSLNLLPLEQIINNNDTSFLRRKLLLGSLNEVYF